MSTQRLIRLRCMCWQHTVPNKYIQVKFDIGYLQWYVSMTENIIYFIYHLFEKDKLIILQFEIFEMAPWIYLQAHSHL